MTQQAHNRSGQASVRPTIYTIGHSNHPFEKFVELLHLHEINLLVDTRSKPQSRWPQFNLRYLSKELPHNGITYSWMGDALGGKPADPSLYGDDEKPDFAAIARTAPFNEAVSRLVNGCKAARIAVMCGEGDPRGCHRRGLITPALLKRDVQVVHILPDGSLVSEADLAQEDAEKTRQLALLPARP